MIIGDCFKLPNLLLVAILLIGLGLFDHVNAREHAFLVDLNSKKVTELGTLTGDSIVAKDINDAGQVVGWASKGEDNSRSFITGRDGIGMRELGTLGNDNGHRAAFSINNNGQVAGHAYASPGGPWHAFITGPDGTGIKDLGTLGGDGDRVAYGLNNGGQVVGGASTADESYHAYITGLDGVNMRDLDVGYSWAKNINDAGQVVGEFYAPGEYFHGFITGPNGMGMRDLGTLGGTESVSEDINNVGQVVGQVIEHSHTAEKVSHAFITGLDGAGMRDLGTLGGLESFGLGINEVGQVVGVAHTAHGVYHAFITGPNGEGMTDLNLLVDLPKGVILTEADAINNNGQVIAAGTVPEPQTYALMLAGLGLLALMVRARERGD